MCGWDITLREVVFSILIVGLMGFIGFLVSQHVEKTIYDKTLKYRQAPSIESDDQFAHALNTDVGDIFANGKFNAKDTVTYKHVDGEHLCIRIVKQEYRMHTEHYTTRDSKGRVHRHVRHYWSWDTISTKKLHSKEVMFCGVTFPYEKFCYGQIGENETIYKESFWKNTREVIYTTSNKFNATIFGNARNGTLHGNSISLMRCGIEEYRKRLTTSHFVPIFWLIWVLGTILVVVAFYYFENNWLED